MRRLLLALALALALPLLLQAPAQAQDWPSRSITLVVPLAPGSTADIVSRLMAEQLGKRLGQTLVVENRPAAGGTLAMQQVAQARPDGYTLTLISQGTHAFNPVLYAKPGYDPIKDFQPITPIAYVSNVMIVPPSDPARSVAEVIERAKAKPGELTFSSGGSGTSHHMSGVLFSQMTGAKLTHVPYRGAPQGINAVATAEVNMGFFNTPTVIALIKDGKLKPLAVTSTDRSPHLPELVTLDKAGVPGYDIVTWMGYAAPAGTPAAITDRLHGLLAEIMRDPAVRERMTQLGFDLMEQLPPERFRQFIASDIEKWGPIVKASGATAD